MAQATGRDIVSAQGFWDKPEKDQVSALAAVSPKFKSSNPQVQRATLQKLHEMSGGGTSPAAKPPSAPVAPKAAAPQAPPPAPSGKPAAAPPEEDLPENQPGIHVPSLSEFGRFAKDWALGGPNSIQATVKPAIAKGVGWAAGKIDALEGSPKESQEFTKGFYGGMAEMGVDMTTPANMGMIAAMVFGGEIVEGGELLSSAPKAAKFLKLLLKAAKLGFQGEQAADLLKSIDGATEAYANKDFEGLGKAAARAISDALLIEGARRSGKAKAPEAEAPPKTPGRFDQPAEHSGVASEWNRLVEETKKKAETKAPAARPPEPVKPSGKPTPPKSAQEAERRVLDATEADRQRREEELLAKYDKSKSATSKAPPQGPPKLPTAGPGKPATPPPAASPEFESLAKRLAKGVRREAPGGAVGAGAPDTPQQAELNQAVRSIFEQATAANLEGVMITAVDADGKTIPLGGGQDSIEFETDMPPLTVARQLAKIKGIARLDIHPIGKNKAGLRKWSRAITGKPVATPPLNMPTRIG